MLPCQGGGPICVFAAFDKCSKYTYKFFDDSLYEFLQYPLHKWVLCIFAIASLVVFPKVDSMSLCKTIILRGHCTILIALGTGIIVILRGDMHGINVEVGGEINKGAS